MAADSVLVATPQKKKKKKSGPHGGLNFTSWQRNVVTNTGMKGLVGAAGILSLSFQMMAN